MKKAAALLLSFIIFSWLLSGQVLAQVRLNKILIDSGILKARLGDYQSALNDLNKAVAIDSGSH